MSDEILDQHPSSALFLHLLTAILDRLRESFNTLEFRRLRKITAKRYQQYCHRPSFTFLLSVAFGTLQTLPRSQ